MPQWWRWLRRSHRWTEIRLLISDVDGTLLVGGEELSDSVAERLRALSAGGVQCAFASARPYPSLAQLARNAGVPAWIISLDGALLHDPSGTVRFAATFPPTLLEHLLELASHYAIHYASFTADVLLQTAEIHLPSYLDDPLLERSRAQLRRDFVKAPSVLLCFSGTQPHVMGFVRALENLPRSERRQLSIAVVESVSLPGTTLAEIRLRQAHKGTAARALQRLLGLSPRQTLAVGDYRNDLPLFAACGIRVAMADAVAELRSKADWITSRPAAEHGIEEVLDRLLAAHEGRSRAL